MKPIEEFLNKITCIDCIEGLQQLPDACIDLTITSPPYNCGIEYDTWKDNLPWNEYLAWCEKWLKEVYRVTKPDGRICVNILMEMGVEDNKVRVSPYAEFYHLYHKVGFHPFGSPVWADPSRVKYTAWGSWLSPSAVYIYNPYEVVLIGYKDQWKKIDKGEATITDKEFKMGCAGVWKFKTQTKEITKANFHPELPALCMKLLSYKKNVILDPFMGGGTTAVACVNLDRNFIGFEISKNYFRIAQKRLRQSKIMF